MFYPRTLRNVGAALALATFAMFSVPAFAASAQHTPHPQSGHHAKAHASSSKHRHHGAATKTSAHKKAKAHARKTPHGKKKAVKTHHTSPPKTTHRTRPTVASQRHPHSRA